MKIREAFIIVLMGTLTIGCTTFRSAQRGSEEMYRVEAFFAEVDETQFEQLDLSWEVDQAGAISSIISCQPTDLLNVILSSKRNQVDIFPEINLDPGERRLIDMQRPMTYPTALNDDGSVMEEETRGVGLLIEASILLEEDGTLNLSYRIEKTALVSWISYTAETENRKVDQPIFASRTIDSRIVVDTLGQWYLTGELIRMRVGGKQTHFLSGIRVQENN